MAQSEESRINLKLNQIIEKTKTMNFFSNIDSSHSIKTKFNFTSTCEIFWFLFSICQNPIENLEVMVESCCCDKFYGS